MRRLAFVLSACAVFLLASCSDDTTSPSTKFDLTLRVVDQGGEPAPGLDLMLVMDSPFYQDGRMAEKAAVAITFSVPAPAHVTVSIEDAAGIPVRAMVDEVLVAGVHRVMWNGTDDEGVHRYSGLYYARMIGRDQAGAVVHDQRQPMFLAMLDFDRATIGTTDAAGELVLKDRRLFPALYGDVAMQALDENGESVGAFPLTHTMRFYLRDPAGGGAVRYDREVTRSGQVIELTWPGAQAAAPAAVAPVRPDKAGGADPPAPVYNLYPPHPNPFN